MEIHMSDQNNKTDNDSQENTQQDERVIIPTTRLTADDKEETQEIPSILPVLPVRDVVIFNYMVLPLFITRERSVSAVEKALASSRHMLVCAQKDENVEDPGPDDLYTVGTVVNVMRVLKLPDSRVKLLIQGICRARVLKYLDSEKSLDARIRPIPEVETETNADIEAQLRTARAQSEKVLALRGIISPDISAVLASVEDPGRLADLIAANIRMKTAEAQQLLETEDAAERLRLVNEKLAHEVDIATVQAKIQNVAREGMDKAQKDYYLREQIKAIRQELGEKEFNPDDEIADLKKRIAKAGLPTEVRKEAEKQLQRLAGLHGDTAEANVINTYLDWILMLPWKKTSKDAMDIAGARKVLDEDHCGLEKVKERILEFLSVRKLNPNSKGPILCLVGPPGVGKTSLGRSIARAMKRKFQRLSLGGMRDEAEIRGHRRTYIGAMPGRIIQALKQAGTRNPVIVLDEVDKIGTDFRGDPSSALLEVLDPEQNATFSDHYLNVPFNLSKVLFLCTANQMDPVPAALKDRMEVIKLSGYTAQEKLEIAKQHLLPKQIHENGLALSDVSVEDAAIDRVISEYTREAGVRNLERELASLCRKLARKKAEGESGPFSVSADNVQELLGVPRYIEDEKEKSLMPGTAQGLAWTAAGGVVLTVEACLMKGKGVLTTTGQLGDVMKESAQAAVSYIRSRADTYGIDPDFMTNSDVHIHFPEGATPKDGPSAGVTMTTALLSAITKCRVRADVCMTGEITLQGRVLPVGGIKEKILAGVARGLTHVLIPKENTKDLEDIPADLLQKITVHKIHSYEDVIPLAFEDPKALHAHP
ncbi:MAG: endopeptidase La [Desulfovibrionaceae bacterium]|nr:endopeptidase La [Desulfovibrionaceae bacterium]